MEIEKDLQKLLPFEKEIATGSMFGLGAVWPDKATRRAYHPSMSNTFSEIQHLAQSSTNPLYYGRYTFSHVLSVPTNNQALKSN